MLGKGSMLGQRFGQIPNQTVTNFMDLSQLVENALNCHPTNDLSTISGWYTHPRIYNLRVLIRKRINEILDLKENDQFQQNVPEFIADLENELFMEAASEDEYANQETLRSRLQNLISRKIDDMSCIQQASNHPAPASMGRPTFGLTHYGNSVAVNLSFNQSYCDGTGYDAMVVHDTDKFNSIKGSLNGGYKTGNAGMFDTSPAGMRQTPKEKVYSPEIGSTITTCSSADGFSELGSFDSKPFFCEENSPYSFKTFQQQQLTQGSLNLVESRNVSNDENIRAMACSPTLVQDLDFSNSILQVPEHVSYAVPEERGMFPDVDFGIMNSTLDNLPQSKSRMLGKDQQQSAQPYRQLDRMSDVEAPCYLVEENQFCIPVSGQIAAKNSKLLPVQSQGSHVASESSVSSSKRSRRQTNLNQPQFSKVQILLDYINYKNSTLPIEDFVVSFINHLHSKWCNKGMCMCEHFCWLLLHFNNCHFPNCSTCGPVRDLQNDRQFHQSFKNGKNGLVRDFDDTSSSRHGSCGLENVTPPLKRQRMENSFHGISSENGIKSVLAPLMVQHCDLEGLPPLRQWPESPVSITSEVMELNVKSFTSPLKCSINLDQINDTAFDKIPRLNAETMPAPTNELIVDRSEDSRGSISETADIVKDDFHQFSEIVDVVKNDSHQLRFNAKPVICEERGTASEEESLHTLLNFELAKQHVENELNAQEAEHEKEMKSESPKIKGLSMIEFFTSEQIMEHISSLGQRIGLEEEAPKTMHPLNENTCQLCAADKLLLGPVPIYCSSCGARVKRGVNYYTTSKESGMHYCFCTTCYKMSRGGIIKIHGINIPKPTLDKRKNDEETEEPWVQCDKCKKWQHQICALFNDKRDMEGKAEYECPKCCLDGIERKEHAPMSIPADFCAKDLPSTMLSDYIEQRLFRCLQQERKERAEAIGKNLDEVPAVEGLAVRVVSSVKKQVSIKKQFLEILEDYPAEFPYTSKVILLFQKIEGVDVCLFCVYVQEYGSDCSPPNKRCVYISYLDSVKYFRPETRTAAGEALRTFVYHEILIGYLEYCKKRGFTTCYLWACPPRKGEDFILYCHPENQKTPKSDKLRQWYHSMLRKAAKENIVVNLTNLYDHYFVSTGQSHSKITAARLPYFDGDYWSGAAENVIKSFEQQTGEYSGRKVKKVMTKRTLKAMGHTDPSGCATKDILLMQKLGQSIFAAKEDFIIAHLQFVCTHCHDMILSGWRWSCDQCKKFWLCQRCHDEEQRLNGRDTHISNSKEKHLLSKVMVDDIQSDTEDGDAILDTSVFENRHIFLGFCQQNRYQFDTLRRAKHSSMMILHQLHNPTLLSALTTCKICHQDTDIKGGDVCVACREAGPLCTHSTTTNTGTKSKDGQQQVLQQKGQPGVLQMQKELLNVLEHAFQCKPMNGDPCSYPKCILIKRLFNHARDCKVRIHGGCQPCRKVWQVLKLHSVHCTLTDCRVPHCRDLKNNTTPPA